jgi:hypothetical protein
VRNNVVKYLDACEEEPVFVTRSGKIRAVLEHMRDEDIEDYLLERNPKFRKMLERAEKKKGGMRLAQYRHSRQL